MHGPTIRFLSALFPHTSILTEPTSHKETKCKIILYTLACIGQLGQHTDYDTEGLWNRGSIPPQGQ